MVTEWVGFYSGFSAADFLSGMDYLRWINR